MDFKKPDPGLVGQAHRADLRHAIARERIQRQVGLATWARRKDPISRGALPNAAKYRRDSFYQAYSRSKDNPLISPSIIFLPKMMPSISANSLDEYVLSDEKLCSSVSESDALRRTVTPTVHRSPSGM